MVSDLYCDRPIEGFEDVKPMVFARRAKISYYQGDFEWAQAQLDVLKKSTDLNSNVYYSKLNLVEVLCMD